MDIRALPKIEALIKEEGKNLFVVLKYENYKKLIQKLQIEGSIDEEDYLKRYPEVNDLIRQKKISSANDHYLKTGYVEQRKAKVDTR